MRNGHESVQTGEWPAMAPAGVAYDIGRRAAKWLEERANPALQKGRQSTVKFTPHTEAEKAAWRQRIGGRQ